MGSTSDYQSGIAKFSNQIGHYSVDDGILASSTGGLLPVYTNTNAHNLYIALNRALPLLCTVNNLSKEVIKTSSQTMKITYEITQG